MISDIKIKRSPFTEPGILTRKTRTFEEIIVDDTNLLQIPIIGYLYMKKLRSGLDERDIHTAEEYYRDRFKHIPKLQEVTEGTLCGNRKMYILLGKIIDDFYLNN